MAIFAISGTWKDSNGVIIQYAFHIYDKQNNTVSTVEKYSKSKAITALEKAGNSAFTIMWDYKQSSWMIGEDVQVVGTSNKYLRTDPDDKTTDNLAHLIDFSTVFE